MLIGLVRHFKVDIRFAKTLYTPRRFNDKMAEYDRSPILPNGVDLGGIDWNVCYASTLPRAAVTAETIYSGEIIKTDLLREVDVKAFTKFPLPLPGTLWHFGGRIAWYKNKPSQPESFIESKERADKLLNLIFSCGKENVLCVSHGFFMGILFRKLLKLGYKADVDMRPKNGKLYIFSSQ